MRTAEMESRIMSAFASATPDVFDRIEQKWNTKKKPVVVDLRAAEKEVNRYYLRRAIAIAAAVAVVFASSLIAAGVIFFHETERLTVDSDVSLTLSFNTFHRAISAFSDEPEGARAAKKLNVRGMTQEDALKEIVNLMTDSGHLSADENAVLLTAKHEEETTAQTLRKTSADVLMQALKEKGISAAVYSQIEQDDPALLRNAKRNKISVGKAAMIAPLLNENPRYNFKSLSPMSIHSIALIEKSLDLAPTGLTEQGELNSSMLLSAEEAGRRALSHLGTKGEVVSTLLTGENGVLVWLVRIKDGGATFSYTLNATNGEIFSIVKSEKNSSKTLYQSANSPSSNTRQDDVSPTLPDDQTSPDETQENEPASQEESLDVTEQPSNNDPPPAVSPTKNPVETQKPGYEEEETPALFSKKQYLSASMKRLGQSESFPSSTGSRTLSSMVVLNEADTFFDETNFPYSDPYTEGSMTALVCNKTQFKALLHRDDARFSDSFFKSSALLINLTMHTSSQYQVTGSAVLLKNGQMRWDIRDAFSSASGIGEHIFTVTATGVKINKADIKNVKTLSAFLKGT